MPMKEGYGKSKGNSLEENPKMLDKLRDENHKALKNIPEIK
jgi:hypothetical protein